MTAVKGDPIPPAQRAFRSGHLLPHNSTRRAKSNSRGAMPLPLPETHGKRRMYGRDARFRRRRSCQSERAALVLRSSGRRNRDLGN